MHEKAKRSNFSGSFGFIMAAAGSAVGLGNIWRFPYLAAKDGGGVFLLCYLVLAVTFGFTLLTTEVAIGRKTRQGPLTAYSKIKEGWGWLGVVACLVPVIILPYYCAIGGWVVKYLMVFLTGSGTLAAEDGYFGSYITSTQQPFIYAIIFLFITSFVVISGVEKGIEKYSKILMPILFVLIIGISIFSLTIHHTDDAGVTRTGLEGLKIYVIPNFEGMTLKNFMFVLLDAMGQLFFSISVCMGIMVAYGSYATKGESLMKSINQIELFDTLVAFLAGLMIIPAVYSFMGSNGMSAGPGLMFVSLPKVFHEMGKVGYAIGVLFFVMVLFAAVTSSVSIMEAIVASLIDKFHMTRKKAAILVSAYSVVFAIIVCMGYNFLYFEIPLPNGSTGQILDIMDYVSNSILMPVLGMITCIFIGWIVKPQIIIDEVTDDGKYRFGRKGLYIVMIKFIAPVLLFILLLSAMGLLKF